MKMSKKTVEQQKQQEKDERKSKFRLIKNENKEPKKPAKIKIRYRGDLPPAA